MISNITPPLAKHGKSLYLWNIKSDFPTLFTEFIPNQKEQTNKYLFFMKIFLRNKIGFTFIIPFIPFYAKLIFLGNKFMMKMLRKLRVPKKLIDFWGSCIRQDSRNSASH